ncbi:hypothetical protein D9M68_670830 [compost metagenome]
MASAFALRCKIHGDLVTRDQAAPTPLIRKIKEGEAPALQANGLDQLLTAIVQQQDDQPRRDVVVPLLAARHRLGQFGHGVQTRPQNIAVEGVDPLPVVRRQWNALNPATGADNAVRMEVTIGDAALAGALDDRQVLCPETDQVDRLMAVIQHLVSEGAHLLVSSSALDCGLGLEGGNLIGGRRAVCHPLAHRGHAAYFGNAQRLLGQREDGALAAPVGHRELAGFHRAVRALDLPHPEHRPVLAGHLYRPGGCVLEVPPLVVLVSGRVVEERALATRAAGGQDPVIGCPQAVEPLVDVTDAGHVNLAQVRDR